MVLVGNFLIWGFFHGLFLASEHAGFSKILIKMWKPLQHLYLLIVIIIGWVFFRADTLPQAMHFLFAMVDLDHYQTSPFLLAQVMSNEAIYAFCIGIFLSIPFYPYMKNQLVKHAKEDSLRIFCFIDMPRITGISALLFLSILKVASSTYNPFIYFRF